MIHGSSIKLKKIISEFRNFKNKKQKKKNFKNENKKLEEKNKQLEQRLENITTEKNTIKIGITIPKKNNSAFQN